MSTLGRGARTLSVKPQSITDLAEVWDELTPIQQQFMIQRAKGLAGYNKMQSTGAKFEDLHTSAQKVAEQAEPEK